jgi:DNA repair photolyase
VDAWCPAAQQHNLGRRFLEVLLAEPGWTVRILTKNAAVTRDYDLISKHRDRVLVGLSLTGTADKEDVLAVIEPNASPISQRMEALSEAHAQRLRTYGMLCPLLPGVSNSPAQLETLVDFLDECGVEEVFAEAVNQRGSGLKDTEEVLRQAGFISAGEALAAIRSADRWSVYVADLLRDLQEALRNHGMIDKLRFLLYSSKLQPADRARIETNAAGVVLL